jgi:hypothetical protein
MLIVKNIWRPIDVDDIGYILAGCGCSFLSQFFSAKKELVLDLKCRQGDTEQGVAIVLINEGYDVVPAET